MKRLSIDPQIKRKYWDQGIKRSRDQGIKGSRDQGIKGSRDQGIKGSRDQGIKGSRDQGIKGSWIMSIQHKSFQLCSRKIIQEPSLNKKNKSAQCCSLWEEF